MDADSFSGVLDAVYAAAASYERWPLAVEKLADAFHCEGIALIDRNLSTMEGRVITKGFDRGSQQEFLAVWSARDVIRQKTRTWQSGAVETDKQILPRSELVSSDFYNGFLKPRDMNSAVRFTLAYNGKFLKALTMWRPDAVGEFDLNAVEQCRLLMPHLQRAVSISLHAEQARATVGALSDITERSDAAILLCDRDGKVKFANRAARAMAQGADAFRLSQDGIEILDPRDAAALQRLIAGATGRLEQIDAARGGVMRLSRKSGKAPLTVIVAPVARTSAWLENGSLAYVVISNPDAALMRPETMLRQLYGLSAAETRVAERLMMGDNPEQAAAVLNVKISTARWHLASLYRKTGTKRQAELVRLLLSLPAV
jgi:DNA-binding CsgD family transcriptional regulator/PAS domain-containing protein